MEPTHHDFEAQTSKVLQSRTIKFIEALANLLRPIFRGKWVSRQIQRTTSGRIGAISGLGERGRNGEAARRAIELLEGLRDLPSGRLIMSGRDYCWLVTDLAAQNLAQVQDPVLWNRLIALATDGVVPISGYSAASSFLHFARWKLSAGETDAARRYIEIASGADYTWAEPDFLIGWMWLVHGGGDPIEPLARAIRKDPGILARIVDDPVCGRQPHIVHTLQRRAAEPIVNWTP